MSSWMIWRGLVVLVLLLGWPAVSQECDPATHALVGTPAACLPIFLQQGAPLQAEPVANRNSSRYGNNVALSKSGDILVVSSTAVIQNRLARPVIQTFAYDGAKWAQVGPALVFNRSLGFASAEPRISLALSGNGSTLAVGLADMVGPKEARGPRKSISKVVVYQRSLSNTWEQIALLVKRGTTAQSSDFGTVVALSEDGNWLAVTAPFAGQTGGAFVYMRNGSNWDVTGPRLFDPAFKNPYVHPGGKMALSADGSTLAFGSWDYTAKDIWIYTRSVQGVYGLQTRLRKSSADNISRFGPSVALSRNGNTLAVEAYPPQVFVITRTGTTWTVSARIVPPDTDLYQDVSLSWDGETLAIGVAGYSNPAGGAYVYVLRNGKWLQLGKRIVSVDGRAAESHQGCRLQLSGTGNVLALAGRFRDKIDQDIAWMFRRAPVA